MANAIILMETLRWKMTYLAHRMVKVHVVHRTGHACRMDFATWKVKVIMGVTLARIELGSRLGAQISVPMVCIEKPQVVCTAKCGLDKTAAGNEAVNECNPGKYCCDANRPEISDPPGPGCCDTSNDFFSLPDLDTGSSSLEPSSPETSSAESSSTESPPSDTSPETSLASSSIVETLTVESSSTNAPVSDTGSKDSSGVETTSEASSTTQTTTSATPTTTSETLKSNIITLLPITPTSTQSSTRKTDANTSPSAITSIVFLTSVIINSIGSSTSVITSKTVEPQNTTGSSLAVVTHTPSSSKLGMKIGIGVGIPVGVLGLALLGFLFWRFGRKERPRPQSTDTAKPVGAVDPEYMYKGNADLETPATGTTASPDLNKRASSKYVAGDVEVGTYRGVQTGGLGLHPVSPEPPNTNTQSEFSGSSPQPRDIRDSQMSELAGSRYHPSELPDRSYP